MDRVLDAAKRGCERWGFDRVTIDDIAAEAGISRATLYRMFPGGKDVLFEALRVRELEEFFTILRDRIEGADVGRGPARARRRRRHRRSCAPTSTWRSCWPPSRARRSAELTVEGVPRIIRFATTFLAPLAEPFLDRQQARRIIDILARLTISYFLAPSDTVDLGDEESARAFLTPIIRSTLIEGAIT